MTTDTILFPSGRNRLKHYRSKEEVLKEIEPKPPGLGQ